MTESGLVGHLDNVCCPNCHVELDEDGICPNDCPEE